MKLINCTTGRAEEYFQVNMDYLVHMTRLNRTWYRRVAVTRLTFANGLTLDVAEMPQDLWEKARQAMAETAAGQSVQLVEPSAFGMRHRTAPAS